MAASDGMDTCVLQRARSRSDPNILTESGIELVHSAEMIDQQRVLRSSCLVTGVHTPPIRRNSKLATLSRIFRPWKWRKKKGEKLKQSSTDVALACGLHTPDPGSPFQGVSDVESRLPITQPNMLSVSSMEYLGSDQENPRTVAEHTTEDSENAEERSELRDEDEEEGVLHTGSQGESAEGLHDCLERVDGRGEDLPHGHCPPGVPGPMASHLCSEEDSSPAAVPLNQTNAFTPKDTPRGPEGPCMIAALRGPLTNAVGSPHLVNIHPPLPPTSIIEELHRALANKLRQESIEKESSGETEGRKESEENKENLRMDQYFTDASGRIFDQDGWNESVISGTLPRRMRKELLAVKLRNRPSKQELEDRNIFPARSDQERQEIRQQIEMKLAKRLSQRPAVEELENRNILKQRNDQTEQEERREIKQRLNRKLNQRPTVDELRERKILIRFSDYVEVAKAQDYDRRADKPWTRLSAADKAAIRKELNEFKSTEMEVHASSKHLTRFPPSLEFLL
ncbi:phosphatase and actin regulator 3a [Denticeps clupeoides]|uniref:Phosphatase and actin regulator n=1 Tax=Denticeps clupeoides TaxID=299321 RepID=A0AAY4B8Z2_9TELE|nr:phosphatase and actin regulator 3-like [Denticeps clupeoides]